MRTNTIRLAAHATDVAPRTRYAALNGTIGAALTNGTRVLVSTVLTALGATDDFVRRYASPAGRAVAKAARDLGETITRVWVERDGRWLHVACYPTGSAAITTGLRTYKRTTDLVPAN